MPEMLQRMNISPPVPLEYESIPPGRKTARRYGSIVLWVRTVAATGRLFSNADFEESIGHENMTAICRHLVKAGELMVVHKGKSGGHLGCATIHPLYRGTKKFIKRFNKSK